MAIINTLGGTSLPDLTNPATAANLLSGKQLIDADGEILTGTMPTVGKPSPDITVSTAGLITSTYTLSNSGYITSGTARSTRQITSGIAPTLKPENIKKGVSIFGVVGNAPEYLYVANKNSLIQFSSVMNSASTGSWLSFIIPGIWNVIYIRGTYRPITTTTSGLYGFSGVLTTNNNLMGNMVLQTSNNLLPGQASILSNENTVCYIGAVIDGIDYTDNNVKEWNDVSLVAIDYKWW